MKLLKDGAHAFANDGDAADAGGGEKEGMAQEDIDQVGVNNGNSWGMTTLFVKSVCPVSCSRWSQTGDSGEQRHQFPTSTGNQNRPGRCL